MQDGMNRIRTREDAIAKLIGMLRRSDLSADDIALIQGMLIENTDDGYTEELIRSEFDNMLVFNPKPSAETRRALARVRARLGMEPVRRKRRPFLRTWPARVAAAAVALLLVVGGISLLTNRAGDAIPASWVAVSAAPGTIDEIMLPDGSVVRLRGNTLLEYAGDFARTRAVKLDGEAFFNVTRDSAHPFTVEAGGLTVTVLGTEFNLAAGTRSDETAVTLASGRVEVEAAGQSVEMKPSMRLVMDRATGELSLGQVAGAEIDALRRGALTFDGIPLGEALRCAARFYGIAIELPEGLGDSRTVRVAFDADDDLDDVLFALQAATGLFDYQVGTDVVTVTARR